MKRFWKSILMTLFIMVVIGLEILILELVSCLFGHEIVLIVSVMFIVFAMWITCYKSIK